MSLLLTLSRCLFNGKIFLVTQYLIQVNKKTEAYLGPCRISLMNSQPTFTCSESTVEKLEKGEKYVQHNDVSDVVLVCFEHIYTFF